jgi:hypothetical protein
LVFKEVLCRPYRAWEIWDVVTQAFSLGFKIAGFQPSGSGLEIVLCGVCDESEDVKWFTPRLAGTLAPPTESVMMPI